MAPNGADVLGCDLLDRLPHFNPDLDGDEPPPPVRDLRNALASADAILLSTPEYAGSLPGSFKNLLDWTIGGGSLYRRPVGWINPSPHGGARDAYHALRLVLDKSGAHIVDAACADIPVRRDSVDARGAIGDRDVNEQIGAVVRALARAAGEINGRE